MSLLCEVSAAHSKHTLSEEIIQANAQRSVVKRITVHRFIYANVNTVTSLLPHHNFASLSTITAVANAMLE
jgi:hypothetical protein